jgi:hypothetical protein
MNLQLTMFELFVYDVNLPNTIYINEEEIQVLNVDSRGDI